MKIKSLFFITAFTLMTFSLVAQNNSSSSKPIVQSAENDLSISISGKKVDNIIDPKFTLIKTNKTAIEVAEPLLFSIYGEKTIVDQKPYEVHHITNYWVIRGNADKIPENGGRFLIVLDDRDARVIRMVYLK